MKQQIHLVTLGVADLTESRRFYAGLGFREADCSEEAIAFFDMNGVVLALFPRDLLKQDIGIPDAQPEPGGSTFALNVESREKVDVFLQEAVEAGARLLTAGTEKPWGYTGYFADIDGHVWEIGYVPSLQFDDEGRLAI